MTQRISVLFLLEDLCFGGTQRQTLELARRLDTSRFAPSILTLTGPTDLDSHVDHVPLFHIGRRRHVPPFFFVQLGQELGRRRPDILVPCTALPNIWGRIWGRILDLPCVIGTVRGGGGPRRQYEKYLWKWTTHMICNSPALQHVLQNLGVPPSHLSCILNGVNTELFTPPATPPSSRPPELVCVARLAADKDHATLLQAVNIVRQQVPDVRLRLVGDGPLEQSLRQQVADLGLENTVIFTPGSSEVRGYYAQARIFVLSSVREGLPNVILEAMSSGLPICATAVGGISYLLEEEQCGLCSPAGDASTLAVNLLRLLNSPEEGDRMGEQGRKKALQDFSFTTMVAAHEEIFSRYASSHRCIAEK